MDLFRHRSQSAVSADDKRKAVSLITDLFLMTYLFYQGCSCRECTLLLRATVL